MHTEDTVLAGTEARPGGTPTLTAVVPVAPRATGRQPATAAVALAVASAEPGEPALSVHYALDQATHRWVASILDVRSGEVVCTVPSTQVLHMIASLRNPPVDLRA
ncbi:MAG: hypothetical protein ABI317_04205 [Gaiellales bacterium]